MCPDFRMPQRTGKPGRPRSAYKVPPDDLLYAVVHKRRQHGRVVEVTTHLYMHRMTLHLF
jgi:hypothetical protein